MGIGARGPLGAEPSKVVLTKTPTDMPFRTYRAEWTESLVVVFAWGEAGLLAYVLVQAVIPVRTVSRPGERLTFRHAPKVVFVKIFALDTLFAEALKEMLADKGSVSGRWR